MSQHFDNALVISDGGLASLIAAAMVAEAAGLDQRQGGQDDAPGAILAVPPRGASEEVAGLCARAASLHAEAFGLIPLGTKRLSIGTEQPSGLVITDVLVHAGYAALSHGLSRVVWPVQAGIDPETGDVDLDWVSAAIDRALLVGRLISIDIRGGEPESGVTELRVEVPFVDLTDEQVVELAVDMDLGPSLCWWGGDAPATHPEAERHVKRWQPCFQRLGHPV